MAKLQDTLITELDALTEPLQAAVRNPLHAAHILAGLGLDPIAAGVDRITSFARALLDLFKAVSTLVQDVQDAKNPADFAVAAMKLVGPLRELCKVDFKALLNLNLSAQDAAILARDLADALVVTWLSKHHPITCSALSWTGLITFETRKTSATRPQAMTVWRLHPERLPSVLLDPAKAVAEAWPAQHAARAQSDVEDMLSALGMRSFSPLGGQGNITFEGLGSAPAHQVTQSRLFLSKSGRVGFDLAFVPRDNGTLKDLWVAPVGEMLVDIPMGDWVLGLSAALGAKPFAFGATGVKGLVGDVSASASASLDWAGAEPLGLGGQSTRLELDKLHMQVGVLVTRDGAVPSWAFAFEGARLVLGSSDGDSFLSSLLSSSGTGAGFDLSLAWDSVQGLRFEGQLGLEVDIPLKHKDDAPIQLSALHVGLDLKAGTNQDPEISLELSLSGGVNFGAVLIEVERVGLEALLQFPKAADGEREADFSLAFKPPTGLGIQIDAELVKGAGFLRIDAEAGRYEGVLDLRVASVAVTAMGLLATKLPGGKAGWSFLGVINARFPGIQLGWGFALSGLGGIVGLHRDMNLEAIQGAVRDGRLGSLLFPEDPVADATQILADLDAFFPPMQGQFVFGAMAEIQWGPTKLLSIQLGIVLALPSPLRVALVGELAAMLPDPQAAVVKLCAAFVGAWDGGTQELSFDASLEGSSIVGIPLRGDLALRLRLGSTPVFLLAMGGFHPEYSVPSPYGALQSMKRLGLDLTLGETCGLSLSTYLAITSNSVQLGAWLSAWAKACGFEVNGEAGFDALLILRPFKLKAHMGMQIEVRGAGITLMAVQLSLDVTGPKPWTADGVASFKVLGSTVHFDFHAQSGAALQQGDATVLVVKDLIAASLADEGAVTVGAGTGLTLRGAEGLVDPRGTITVVQRAVPLNLRIERLGEDEPDQAGPFVVEKLSLDGAAQSWTPTQDWFAPSFYLDFTEDERLEAPSFESMDNGCTVGEALALSGNLELPSNYEEDVLGGSLGGTSTRGPLSRRQETLDVAGWRQRLKDKAPSTPAPRAPSFALQGRDGALATARFTTYAAARQDLGAGQRVVPSPVEAA